VAVRKRVNENTTYLIIVLVRTVRVRSVRRSPETELPLIKMFENAPQARCWDGRIARYGSASSLSSKPGHLK
jgi:hypothetical protein